MKEKIIIELNKEKLRALSDACIRYRSSLYDIGKDIGEITEAAAAIEKRTDLLTELIIELAACIPEDEEE